MSSPASLQRRRLSLAADPQSTRAREDTRLLHNGWNALPLAHRSERRRFNALPQGLRLCRLLLRHWRICSPIVFRRSRSTFIAAEAGTRCPQCIGRIGTVTIQESLRPRRWGRAWSPRRARPRCYSWRSCRRTCWTCRRTTYWRGCSCRCRCRTHWRSWSNRWCRGWSRCRCCWRCRCWRNRWSCSPTRSRCR